MKLHFSIRDLLWLTLVAAMGLAWWIDHHDIDGRQSRYIFSGLQGPKIPCSTHGQIRCGIEKGMTGCMHRRVDDLANSPLALVTIKCMKAASILLALVVVLGFVNEAGAFERGPSTDSEHDYTFNVGERWFGFYDRIGAPNGNPAIPPNGKRFSVIHLGGFANQYVRSPFSAPQGLVGFCIILATLIIVPAVLAVRWKKKRV